MTPPVLVLDEPGNGLDPQGIRWLRDLLRGRAAAGGTVFVSSHLLAEVEHLADQVVVISHGRLVAAGELAALQQAGTSVRSPEPGRLTQLLQEAGATVHRGPEGELGALLGLIGLGLIIAGVAAALPSTEHGFLVSAGDVIRLLAATTLAGAVGAVLGAGLGAAIRNLGGAVTAFVLALFMIPPLVVQLFNDAASWIPPALGAVISGVSTDLNTWAALTALLAYGVVPAAAGLISVQRRDVV